MTLESVTWFCYRREDDAKAAFEALRQGPLAGPGRVELRHRPRVPLEWWVVTYDLLVGHRHAFHKVFQVPLCEEALYWDYKSYAGSQGKVEARTGESDFIDGFDAEATIPGLVRAASDLGDEVFAEGIDCRSVAVKRLEQLFGLGLDAARRAAGAPFPAGEPAEPRAARFSAAQATAARETSRPAAAQAIAFSCPHCGKSITVRAQLAGRKGKCKSCGQVLEVPHAT